MTVDIIELLTLARKNAVKVGFLCILTAAIMVGISFQVPKSFGSSSTLIIKPKTNSPGIVLQQMSPFLDFLGSNTSSNYVISILESETLAMQVIEKLELANNKFFMNKPETEREKLLKAFKGKVTITKNIKDELIVRAETLSPELSAEIVNTLVDLYLNSQTEELNTQIQLIDNLKKEYEDQTQVLEQKMINFQLEHRDLMIAGSQAENLVNMIANTYSKKLMSEIAVDQLEKAGGHSGSPLLSSELKMELLKKKAESEGYNRILAQQEDMLKSMPKTIQEFASLKKNLIFNEEMLSAIAVRYHSTKINQELDASQVQVVDKAYPIFKKVNPKRSKYAIFGFLLAFVFCFISLINKNSTKIFILDRPQEI